MLQLYKQASGQVVNLDKSSACFSPYLPGEDIEEIKAALGMPLNRTLDVYLGLPSFIGRNKRQSFSVD